MAKKKQQQPVQPGKAIRADNLRKAGTITCLVQDIDSGTKGLLTCEHVLTDNTKTQDLPAQNPTPGTMTYDIDDHPIGPVVRSGNINYGDMTNDIDATFISTENAKATRREIVDIGKHHRQHVSLDSLTLGQAVQKHGIATKTTRGRITAIQRRVPLHAFGRKYANTGFDTMIEIHPADDEVIFSDRGDSGSLVVTDDKHRRPVAMLAVREGLVGRGFAVPIFAVLRKLRVKFA